MSFQYRLEVLLRLQCSVERQEENRLLACVAKLAGLNAELQAWSDARVERRQMAAEEMRSGLPGVVLQVAMNWEDSVQLRETEIRAQIKTAELERLQQVGVYRKARQKREVLEGLKERLETAFDLDQLRHIQQSADEAFLLRSFYWKNS